MAGTSDGTGAEQSKRVSQTRREPGRVERAEAPSGELDGQRMPTEPPADLSNGRLITLVQRDSARRGARFEQLHRGALGQRRDGIAMLDEEIERLPARTENGHSRGARQHPADECLHAREVLEVVQDQRRPLLGEDSRQGLLGGLTRNSRDRERIADRGRDLARLSHRRERHEQGGDLARELRAPASSSLRRRVRSA